MVVKKLRLPYAEQYPPSPTTALSAAASAVKGV